MCVALVWLTIIGVDYVKNKHHYHLKIRDTRNLRNNSSSRTYSFFNLGLTIFNLCYYNEIDFTLKFNFILYDVWFKKKFTFFRRCSLTSPNYHVYLHNYDFFYTFYTNFPLVRTHFFTLFPACYLHFTNFARISGIY